MAVHGPFKPEGGGSGHLNQFHGFFIQGAFRARGLAKRGNSLHQPGVFRRHYLVVFGHFFRHVFASVLKCGQCFALDNVLPLILDLRIISYLVIESVHIPSGKAALPGGSSLI
jgi:hypothetical protein